MADQFGQGGTVICREQPPVGDDFWLGPKKSAGQTRCDFCKYSQHTGTTILCKRDINRTDV
jgi:hypothetical protein